MGSAVSGGAPVVATQMGENLSAYFRYPANIRKVIYTTNAIESVHRQFRKLTKTKGLSRMKQSVEAALSGTDERSGKMDNADPELNLTLSQLAIYFEGRLNNVMTL